MWARVRGFFSVLLGVLAIAMVMSSNDFFKIEFRYGWLGWVMSIGLILWGLYAMAVGDTRKNAALAEAAARRAAEEAAAAAPGAPGLQPPGPPPSVAASPGIPASRVALYVGLSAVVVGGLIVGLWAAFSMRTEEVVTRPEEPTGIIEATTSPVRPAYPSESAVAEPIAGYGASPAAYASPAPYAPTESAEAARAAGAQGKFWEYRDRLFEEQRSLDRESLERHAADLGLDTAAFHEALLSGAFRSAVEDDAALADRLGAAAQHAVPVMQVDPEVAPLLPPRRPITLAGRYVGGAGGSRPGTPVMARASLTSSVASVIVRRASSASKKEISA